MPKKILLADDSITIQKVVELTFSEGDYLVFTVGNGAQALKKIGEVRPDVALLDVIMPEANGYEVCEKVKRNPETSWIPVLLLTGTFEPFDRKRAEAAGADGHLTKPFESQVLISRVEELIASAPPTVSDAPLSTHGVDTPPLEVSSGEKIPHTTGSPASEGTEEAIRASIVPDRYDDYPVPSGSRPSSETDSVRTPRMAEAEISTSRTGGEPPDAMVETWDELASGLASAPAGERPAAEENPTPTHSFPSEETVSATDTGIFSRAP